MGVHRTGGYLVRPHHLSHTLGFQEPAGVLLWDPSSLISFNSPLKAESPRRQKYFFWIYSERVVTIASSFFWCKQKAPYMQVVQDVSCTLKKTKQQKAPHFCTQEHLAPWPQLPPVSSYPSLTASHWVVCIVKKFFCLVPSSPKKENSYSWDRPLLRALNRSS